MACGNRIPVGKEVMNGIQSYIKMNRITSSVLYSLTGAAMLSSLPSWYKERDDGNEKKHEYCVYHV